MIERKASALRAETTGAEEVDGGDAASPREELRRAKRLAVLKTGARMFNQRGYDRTKLDDIAAELSVSKRTLYYYVKNKDDILFQCNKLAYESLEPALAVCADRMVAPLERIRTLMRAYAHLLSNDFGACLVLTHENLLARESAAELRENRRRLDRTLRGLVEAGIADGTIAPCEPKFATAALYGAFNWLPYWRAGAKSPSYEAIGDAFLDVFFGGLRAQTATAG